MHFLYKDTPRLIERVSSVYSLAEVFVVMYFEIWYELLLSADTVTWDSDSAHGARKLKGLSQGKLDSGIVTTPNGTDGVRVAKFISLQFSFFSKCIKEP